MSFMKKAEDVAAQMGTAAKEFASKTATAAKAAATDTAKKTTSFATRRELELIESGQTQGTTLDTKTPEQLAQRRRDLQNRIL